MNSQVQLDRELELELEPERYEFRRSRAGTSI